MSHQKLNLKEAVKKEWGEKIDKKSFVKPQRPGEKISIFERVIWRKVIFTILVVYLGFLFISGCYAIIDLKIQQNELNQSKIEAVEKFNKMTQDVKWMKTNEAVETLAREQLGMVEPGEILVKQQDTKA